MTRREKILKELETNARLGDDLKCTRAFFEIIYGLPAEIPLVICKNLFLFHLDTLEEHCNEKGWLKELLDKQNKNKVYSFQVKSSFPDNISIDCQDFFYNAVDGILLTYKCRSNNKMFAKACVYTVSCIIRAIASHCWKLEAYSSYKKYDEGGYLTTNESKFVDNIWKKVTKVEWERVASFLEKENICQQEDTINIKEMYLVYQKWEKDELVYPG